MFSLKSLKVTLPDFKYKVLFIAALCLTVLDWIKAELL